MKRIDKVKIRWYIIFGEDWIISGKNGKFLLFFGNMIQILAP